ncbi:hypothetical protein DV738_g4409, partial [Chaetothyriales sp. CBS 135597]
MASAPGVSVQTVKLKVLYTFDADYKDNHLARCPQSLDVNTCFIDSTNQIGLVDLRTCLDAVTAASPELASRVDTDYAVYAFDYSEEDAPLVGQGLLSKHVAAAQEEATGQDGEAMVTGRITTGLMGLLSKNAQPTLEVKLRLKPLAAFASQRTRSGSFSSQDGRIPQWLNGSELGFSQAAQQRPMSPMNTSGLETMQRMLSEGGPPRDRQSMSRPDGMPPSRPGSRPGTPSFPASNNPPQRSQPHARRDSFNSVGYNGDDNADEGPVRKRAKTTKVDWPSKADLNIERKPESLRVAASIASSVRLHRPVAINPALNIPNENSNEELVRPPTPVPAKAGRPRGRPKRPRPSKLANDPSRQDGSTGAEGLVPLDLRESAASSPEDLRPRSAASTPANIPSSPPIMTAPQMPDTASPALAPRLDTNQDSGFMSGSNFDEVLLGDDGQMFNFDDFVLEKGVDPQFDCPIFDQPPLQKDDKDCQPAFGESIGQEGPMHEPAAAQSKEYSLPPPPTRPMSRTQSLTPALRVGMSSPRLAPAPIPRARQIMDEQRAKGWPVQLPQSEPGRIFHRSNTWAPDGSDALVPDPSALIGDESKQKPKKKVGKAQTKARLETAIASGEMPPYCDNCGAIETPAWRRAWSKTFTCSWEEVETSLMPGEVCWKEAIEYGEDGVVLSWKGMKSEKRTGDENKGWLQINLCNPCGLWFHKQKCPRPKEKWEKGPKGGRRRRGGAKAVPVQQKAPMNPRSDAQTPMSDESSPAETAADDMDDDNNTGEDETSDSNEPQLPLMPQNMRSNMRSSSAAPAIQSRRPFPRQVNSSPARGHGSEADPVEIDLTPKPLRRQLFPSPVKHVTQSEPSPISTAVHMATKLPAFVRRSPRLHKSKDVFQIPGVAGAVAITADGKENVLPEVAVDDMYDELFDEPVGDGPQPPTTPARRSERILAKTPQRPFGADMSPNVQRSSPFRTPSAGKNASHPALAALIGSAKKNGKDLTPFTKAIQDAWDHGGVNLDMDFLNAVAQQQTPKKAVPNKSAAFDFPDLPSLKGSSPMTSGGQMFEMVLSELPTDQLQTDLPDIFSTDVAAMPSSPPGFYNFLNCDMDMDNMDWATGMESASLPKGPIYDEAGDGSNKTSQGLRRSPRQHQK